MLARRTVNLAQRVQTRTFVRRSVPNKMGADHSMFEDLPFKSKSVGPAVVGIVCAGVGAVWGSCVHQNKKHGFKGVSSN